MFGLSIKKEETKTMKDEKKTDEENDVKNKKQQQKAVFGSLVFEVHNKSFLQSGQSKYKTKARTSQILSFIQPTWPSNCSVSRGKTTQSMSTNGNSVC